jgi:nicotinate-nucleotide adenylyltransferase
MVALGLDVVRLVPFREPPHRALDEDPGPEVRFRMCALVADGDPTLEVSRVELERPGPSYTADTLAAFHELSPGDELLLILGGDQAAALPGWHEPERVLELATVAVAERADWPRTRVTEAVAGLAGAERLHFFDMPRVDVSSSLVRGRVARGQPIRYLVPDMVASYMDTEGLYRGSAQAGGG